MPCRYVVLLSLLLTVTIGDLKLFCTEIDESFSYYKTQLKTVKYPGGIDATDPQKVITSARSILGDSIGQSNLVGVIKPTLSIANGSILRLTYFDRKSQRFIALLESGRFSWLTFSATCAYLSNDFVLGNEPIEIAGTNGDKICVISTKRNDSTPPKEQYNPFFIYNCYTQTKTESSKPIYSSLANEVNAEGIKYDLIRSLDNDTVKVIWSARFRNLSQAHFLFASTFSATNGTHISTNEIKVNSSKNIMPIAVTPYGSTLLKAYGNSTDINGLYSEHKGEVSTVFAGKEAEYLTSYTFALRENLNLNSYISRSSQLIQCVSEKRKINDTITVTASGSIVNRLKYSKSINILHLNESSEGVWEKQIVKSNLPLPYSKDFFRSKYEQYFFPNKIIIDTKSDKILAEVSDGEFMAAFADTNSIHVITALLGQQGFALYIIPL